MPLKAESVSPDWFKHRGVNKNLIVNPVIPWLMIGFPVLILITIVIYPTIWMGYHAFQNTNMMKLFYQDWEYIGWQNFATVLSDDRMWDSVGRLIQYLVFGACLEVLLGTVLALTLFELVKSQLARVIILILLVLPMMLPPSIVATLWKFLLQAYNGAVNHLLIKLEFWDPWSVSNGLMPAWLSGL